MGKNRMEDTEKSKENPLLLKRKAKEREFLALSPLERLEKMFRLREEFLKLRLKREDAGGKAQRG